MKKKTKRTLKLLKQQIEQLKDLHDDLTIRVKRLEGTWTYMGQPISTAAAYLLKENEMRKHFGT